MIIQIEKIKGLAIAIEQYAEEILTMENNDGKLEWGLMDFKNSLKWQYIILHHSMTKDGKVVDWEAIRRYHIETNGWDDIGYHLGIEKVNDELVIQYGRELSKVGAHCRQNKMNYRGIGICLIGNYDLVPPDKDKWDLLLALCRELQKKFNIPNKNVKGHREFASYKSCPGSQFDMARFRGDLANG